MKKHFLLTMSLAVLTGLTSTSQTFVVDGLSYKVLSATEKTVEVTRPAKTVTIAEVVVPATVTNGDVTYTVTAIGNQAFQLNETVTSVKLPDGILSIGNNAFQQCKNLVTFEMGNKVTSIGQFAFSSSAKLKEMRLSKTVKTIGPRAFMACSALEVLDLGEDLEAVPDWMCHACSNLRGITVPDKVTTIGASAFRSNTKADTIQIGKSVTSIGDNAFAYSTGCTKLISLAPTPPALTGDKAIVNTYDKTVLWVSEKSLALYQQADYWKNFKSIKAYDPSGQVGDKLFVVAGVGYELISKDDKTVGIAHIDTLVYKGSVLARNTVDYAGETFKVIAVQPQAFKGATELTQVELPASIATVGDEAFAGCSGLKYLVNQAGTLTTTGKDVFSGVNFATGKLYVPRASAADYKAAAQWKDFTNMSIIIDEVTVDGIIYKCNNIIDCTLDFTGAPKSKGALVIPDEIMVDGYPFTCTVIAGNSFYNTDLTALILPKTLKRIASNAFFTLGAYNRPIERIVVPEGVTSIGSNAFYGCHVNYVDLPEKSLTDLANSAFYGCDIKGIKVPGSVGVIKPSTFYGSDLNWLILGEGITEIQESAFFGTKVGAVRLPNSMKILGKGAFSACSLLSSLTINNGLDSVAEGAFSNCRNLYKIFNFSKTLPEGLEASLTQSGEMTGPERTTYTVSDAFKTGTAFGTVIVRKDLATWFDYKGVRYLPVTENSTEVSAVDGSYLMDDLKVELPEKFTANGKNYTVSDVATYLLCGQSIMEEVNVTFPLTMVPNGFIYNACNVKKVTLPSSVTDLGSYCFAETDSLTSIDLPKNLKNIGLASLYYSGIKELKVPGKVELMDNGSVFGCRNLESLTFEDGEGKVLIGYMPTMFGNRPMFSSSKIKEMTVGRNLNYLTGATYGYSPFYGDSIMEKVVFTDMPQFLGQDLFRSCKSIKSIKIGDNVTTIGSNAFNGCASLDSIAVGPSLRSIGTQAFADCNKLTQFYCPAVTPPTCAANALKDIDKQQCTLYVAPNSVDQYKAAAQWKDFYNIEGYVFTGIESVGVETGGRFLVYNVSGVLVLDTRDASMIDDLPAGLYIINGKKVLKK